MCGIVFYYDRLISTEAAYTRVDAAMQKIVSRGPDEQNIQPHSPAYLGHTRLSIVDLSDSHQPMHSPEGRFSLIFNGEIYNFRELRAQLESLWNFRTRGDTEVLLAGLVLEGEKFVCRLEGMWSFAFWDHVEERLVLSRDRMGKKPLYYFQHEGGFACASELPALRCLSNTGWSEDASSCADYFRYGLCLPGYTLWNKIYEVLPAHNLTWASDGTVEQFPYWSIKLPESQNSFSKEDDAELRQALSKAVRKRLVADVEVGAFLSGGIDSSVIASLAQSSLETPLKTYTIGFKDKGFDESAYAKQVADYLGTEHRCEILGEWDERALEDLLTSRFGQPFADVSLLPTSLVSKVAAEEVKVVLTGDGADEMFGGYQRYQARRLLQWYFRLPLGLRKYASDVVRRLPEPMSHHSHSLLKKAQLFVDISDRYDENIPYVAPTLFTPQEFSSLFPALSGMGHSYEHIDLETGLDDLERMLYCDAQVYMAQDILPKVDRATMAHGLEARSPFLDHNVVELAFSKCAKQHCRIGSGKRWIRRAFKHDIPLGIWKRRKQGFGVPVHSWFRGELGDRFRQLLLQDSGFVDMSYAEALLTEHQEGKRDNGYRLWAIYAYFLAR